MEVYRAREAVVRFGVFEADLRSVELRKQGVKVKLQEQPFQILRILLEHPGEVVTREELQRKIWPVDTFVDFDHGLNNAIRRLREALGDTADTPRFIETLPKRGYRFIGPVNGKGSAGVVPVQDVPPVIRPATVHRRWRRTLAASLLVGAGVALVLAVALSSVSGKLGRWLPVRSSSSPIHSLAVLPLRNLSGDPAQEYFADGMTEELITEVSRVSSLKVISSTSVMRYKKTDKSLPEIGRELNVDAIVEGSVLRSGERVRITAQLINASNDANVWARTYDRDLRDALTLQSTVASAIADEIQSTLTPAEQVRLHTSQPVNLKAFESYLQGNYHQHRHGRGYGDEESEMAIVYFERAIAEDPTFAPPYIELVDQCFEKQSIGPVICYSMNSTAEKAVALDPTSSHAHNILGKVKWLIEGDPTNAEKEFRQAVLLSRNNAEGHDWLGHILDSTNRLEEGMSEFQLAQELDPANDHLADAFDRRGQYDQAIDRVLQFLQFDPNNGWLRFQLLGYYKDKGAYQEYALGVPQVLRLFGFPESAERVRSVYASSGYRSALQQLAKEGEQLHARHQIDDPGLQAEFYAMAGDKDHAFQWLQKAFEERRLGPDDLKCSPVWVPYCSDSRFVDLVRRVHLQK